MEGESHILPLYKWLWFRKLFMRINDKTLKDSGVQIIINWKGCSNFSHKFANFVSKSCKRRQYGLFLIISQHYTVHAFLSIWEFYFILKCLKMWNWISLFWDFLLCCLHSEWLEYEFMVYCKSIYLIRNTNHEFIYRRS